LPRIQMSGSSAAYKANFGEIFYTIVDTIPYTGTYNGKSEEISPGIYRSRFCRFPQFNGIIRGKGVTLAEKFTSLIERYGLFPDLDLFTKQMANYVYAKYFLIRLLTGKFTKMLLARNRNEEFLRLLESSRYNIFSPLFTNPAYGVSDFYKYFKAFPEQQC